MPTAICDGIRTRYEVLGDGPPLLMLSPGGFNATIENWRTFSIYGRLKLLDHLPRVYSCIAFDKRESGQSGGRVELLTWELYARQAAGLLDHLGIERAHVIGGCIGCSIATTFGREQPERTAGLVLYSPAGGATYRRRQHRRFAEHLAYVGEHGLVGVVELAQSGDASFAQDPGVGPWASVLRTDAAFATEYAQLDPARYRGLVEETARTLFDRDTVPGADPGELGELDVPTLVVPGDDENHPRSAALYLHENLPRSELWDVSPTEQNESNAPTRVLEFLQSKDSPRSSAAI
jgi:pimeloyl-ACP methyl ester carboxylesterase